MVFQSVTVEETVVKEEKVSGNDLIEQDPLEVAGIAVKTEVMEDKNINIKEEEEDGESKKEVVDDTSSDTGPIVKQEDIMDIKIEQ